MLSWLLDLSPKNSHNTLWGRFVKLPGNDVTVDSLREEPDGRVPYTVMGESIDEAMLLMDNLGARESPARRRYHTNRHTSGGTYGWRWIGQWARRLSGLSCAGRIDMSSSHRAA